MQDMDEPMQEQEQEPMPEQGMGDFNLQDASPEEQQQYEHFVAKAMTLMYSDKMRPKVREMLEGEGDPVEGLARAATLIIGRVAVAAEQAGEQLMGDAVFAAGQAIVEDLAEYATKWGIHDFESDRDALEGAYFRTLDQFRVMMQSAGRGKPEVFEEDFKKLVEMNDSGEYENMLRKLADYERSNRGRDSVVNEQDEEAMPPKRGLGAAAAGRQQ